MVVIPSTASSSDWELTLPTCPRRSLPPVAMSRSPRKKRGACAALSAAGIVCSRPPLVDGVLWCHRHNEVRSSKVSCCPLTYAAAFNSQERLKLYTNYKAHGALLKAYTDIPACHDVATIMACDSLLLLREWNSHLRGKYNILTRCVLST